MHLLKRIKSFLERIIWLSKFMPSPLHAIIHLVNIKKNPSLASYGYYKNLRFKFFPKDLSAVKEVLVDQEYQFLSDYLDKIEEPVILDIGANIGTFSLWVLGQNPKAKILSLEASPPTFKTLSETVLYAQQKNMHWTVEHGAAWHNNDHISFSSDGESMGHKVTTSGSENVQGITLKALVNKHLENRNTNQIDIMKVDIEGAEEFFLQDTPDNKEVMKKIERLVIELHPNYCDVSGVEKLIKDTYQNIVPQMDRLSNKPLLYCYN